MIYISLGENCLPDNILNRYKLKSYSTIYSHGRSCLDHAITIEGIDVNTFLDKNNLIVEKMYNRMVVRSKIVAKCDPIFKFSSKSKSFEFTHHNPIEKEEHKQSYIRKFERLEKDKQNMDISFLYHFRNTNDNTALGLQKLYSKASYFANLYSSGGNRCYIYIFRQSISKEGNRNLSFTKITDSVYEFEFSTTIVWEGNDPEVLWAKVDEDLIEKMISTIKSHSEMPNAYFMNNFKLDLKLPFKSYLKFGIIEKKNKEITL